MLVMYVHVVPCSDVNDIQLFLVKIIANTGCMIATFMVNDVLNMTWVEFFFSFKFRSLHIAGSYRGTTLLLLLLLL